MNRFEDMELTAGEVIACGTFWEELEKELSVQG